MAFNNLAGNAERLSRRLQESFQEKTRDFTKSTTASYLDSPDLDKTANLSRLLNSNVEREKLDGLKRIVAMISKNRNVSTYFAQVVKNVASNNLEIRKLVYIFLLRYAAVEPDLALLSINTFQKDLADSNPLIRAMALRVLSGIPVVSIGTIVAAAIRKCASDSNPYVRKAAALAIPKCYNVDTTHLSSLMQTLSILLRDQSPLSIGYTIVAFNAICPDQLGLLHQHYRRLCRMIVDADEWGQIHLLDVLARYARSMLGRPLGDQQDDEVDGGEDQPVMLDSDLDLLLKSSAPLFQSRNPAVVMAVTRTFYYLGPPAEKHKVINPLLRLLHSSREVERVVLENLCVIAKETPSLLRPYTSRFYIRAADTTQVKQAKLRLLVALITPDTAQSLLREFKDYVVDTDDALVSDSVWAIGQCAIAVPDTMDSCLTALTLLIRSNNDAAVAAAVLALKALHQRQSTSARSAKSTNVVARLAGHFDEIRNPRARACILWMVGQYSRLSSAKPLEGIPVGLTELEPWVPDVLRKAVKVFVTEDATVKLQALTLAAKVFVLASTHTQIRLLARYVFSLARYDLDYDVRDRARFLTSLLVGVDGGVFRSEGEGDEDEVEIHDGVILRTQQVKHVLFEGKAVPRDENRWQARHTILGSASLVTNKEILGGLERRLPDWPEEGTDASLRDNEDDLPTAPFYTQPENKYIGMGSQSFGGGSGVASSSLTTPIVLTPGGVSPVGSMPKPGFAAPKPQYMDLEAFFKSDDEEGEEEEDEEDAESEDDRHVPTTSTSTPVHSFRPSPALPPVASSSSSARPAAPQDPSDDEEYTDEESDEDSFLVRG